jgi:hypothetical protein
MKEAYLRRQRKDWSRQMANQRIEKWTRWMDGTIKSNVMTMHLHRDAYRKVSEMLTANADNLPESYWWEFMRDTYATTQAVAVRRQADAHPDVASLGKLIEQVRDDAGRITREFWLGLWQEPGEPPYNPDNIHDRLMRVRAERGWNDQYAGSVGTHLDPAIPAADFDRLRDIAAKVKGYVDQHVAHADAAVVSAKVTLTLAEVHDAVDVIGDLFGKYYNLLTASFFTDYVPAIQHDWMAAFRVPWMRPGWTG